MESAVRGMSGGLEASVEEKGSNFSMGERQLLCLARTVLSPAKIVCIDEATANVDLDTDRMVQVVIIPVTSVTSSLCKELIHELNAGGTEGGARRPHCNDCGAQSRDDHGRGPGRRHGRREGRRGREPRGTAQGRKLGVQPAREQELSDNFRHYQIMLSEYRIALICQSDFRLFITNFCYLRYCI